MTTPTPPPLSVLTRYTVDHLVGAARPWQQQADNWVHATGAVKAGVLGSGWDGAGFEAAAQRSLADHAAVGAQADRVVNVAALVQRSASDLYALHGQVMQHLDDIDQAGFEVDESYGVTDRRNSSSAAVLAQRQAQAQALAGELRLRVGDFWTHELTVAGQITAAAGDGPQWRGGVQAVDFKTAPGGGQPTPVPGPQPFLPQYEAGITGSQPAAPAPLMPASPTTTGPHSPACTSAVQAQEDERERQIMRNMLKGAAVGGAAGVTVDGIGALPGAISGAAIGGIGTMIDQATTAHPMPKECQ
jgi:hypothetical protein